MAQETFRGFEVIYPFGFETTIHINGLPLTFIGNAPDRPQPLFWTLTIPSPEKKLAEIIGFIEVDSGDLDYHKAELYLRALKSRSRELEDPYYKDLRGIGHFFLDNLVEYADIRSWRVSAYPLETSGVISQADLEDFYYEKDFYGGGLKVRKPQSPTGQTDIARILGY